MGTNLPDHLDAKGYYQTSKFPMPKITVKMDYVYCAVITLTNSLFHYVCSKLSSYHLYSFQQYGCIESVCASPNLLMVQSHTWQQPINSHTGEQQPANLILAIFSDTIQDYSTCILYVQQCVTACASLYNTCNGLVHMLVCAYV